VPLKQVYKCTSVFTGVQGVYRCTSVFTGVHACLQVYTRVYRCYKKMILALTWFMFMMIMSFTCSCRNKLGAELPVPLGRYVPYEAV
jgi:hypothetical protein